MIRLDRERAIVRAVRAHGALSVAEIARLVDTSASTVRRDLVRLDQDGLLRRTYGGAARPDAERDDPFGEVARWNAEGKQRIAELAVQRLDDGQTVIIDIGTTTYELARLLHGRRVTIVTPSLPVFEELHEDHEVQLILLGGSHLPEYRCLVGQLTEQALADIHADLTFLSTSGVTDGGGLRDTTSAQVPIKRAMMAASATTVLLADHTKFPGKGSFHVGGVDELSEIITDAAPSPQLAARCERAGTSIDQA